MKSEFIFSFSRARRRFLLGAAATVVSLTACDKPPAEPAQSGAARREMGFVLWDAPRPLAPLAFQDGEGRPLGMKDFRGKAIVLNVWATWCGPCREEMPTLDALQAKLGGPTFEVLALSIDQGGPTVVREFFRDVGIKHLRLTIDPTGQALNTLNILGIPTTLLIDRQGRELGRLTGIAKWDSPEMVKFLNGVIDQTKGDK